jgi:Na+/glutamate symporter
MSSDGFHVHGPHDHAIEHVAQGHGDHADHAAHNEGGGVSMNRIAMFTAILATVGAIFSYMGGATQANAGLFKNNAALIKAQASNQWNYFQAKSTKQSLAELARDFAPADKKAKYDEKIERYEKEKKDIQKDAEKQEAISKEWDKQSDEQMHQHHRWAQATTVLQVAIALAAIALLTRRKWLERAMYGVAFVGLVVGALATMHI